MDLALFSEGTVHDYFDRTVVRQAEYHALRLDRDQLCEGDVYHLVEDILDKIRPERLLVEPEVHSSGRDTGSAKGMFFQRWQQFSGPSRLLQLRPRRYHMLAPRIVRLEAPTLHTPGKLIIEQQLASVEDVQDLERYAAEQFEKVYSCSQWLNEDLDFHEQSLRGWLTHLLESKKKRLCSMDVADGGSPDVA
ncbi:hypothetical protein KQI65_13460 [bacterium]|nr:hypothetical protein [bacterium]